MKTKSTEIIKTHYWNIIILKIKEKKPPNDTDEWIYRYSHTHTHPIQIIIRRQTDTHKNRMYSIGNK